MMTLDLNALRAEVRALAYVRGTPAEAAMWREDDEDSRPNLAIEGMTQEAHEHLPFDMLREEAVPLRWRRKSSSSSSAIPMPIRGWAITPLERAPAPFSNSDAKSFVVSRQSCPIYPPRLADRCDSFR
ncbi:hypothetical protein AB3M93_18655 [Novosphingobium panipatense]|uniref:hypothetical protein n=1 Tax=Novosphingobium panipatense TaxID=428991 RepID=UPI0039A2F62F